MRSLANSLQGVVPLVLAVAQIGCFGGGESLWKVISPSGTRAATVVRFNPQGALGPYEYEIWVEGGAKDRATHRVWYSYRVRPVYLFWVSDSELEIHFSDEEGGQWKASSARFVQVSTRKMLARHKSSLVDS